MVVTIVYHVPRNQALAALDGASADAPARWARYLTAWTAWNHARTVSALAAATALIVSLRY